MRSCPRCPSQPKKKQKKVLKKFINTNKTKQNNDKTGRSVVGRTMEARETWRRRAVGQGSNMRGGRGEWEDQNKEVEHASSMKSISVVKTGVHLAVKYKHFAMKYKPQKKKMNWWKIGNKQEKLAKFRNQTWKSTCLPRKENKHALYNFIFFMKFAKEKIREIHQKLFKKH